MELDLPGSYSSVGFNPPETLAFAQWSKCGETLFDNYHMIEGAAISIMWIIGDWLNFGERKYGEMYAQAIDNTRFSISTLRNAKFVASKIPFTLRREDISFSHYQAMASLDVRALPGVIRQIREKDLTVSDTKRLVYDRDESGYLYDVTLKVSCEKTYRVRADSMKEAKYKATRKVRCNTKDTDVIKTRKFR